MSHWMRHHRGCDLHDMLLVACEKELDSCIEETWLEVWEQMSVAVRTSQNVIYGVRRTLHARVIAILTVCLRLLRVLVKLAGITHTGSDWRHIGRINILLLQPIPSDFSKPRVVHHILAAAVKIAEALGEVRSDELLEQVMSIWVDVRRVLDSRLEDIFVDFHWRTAIPEGREAAEHFKDENAKRPPGKGKLSS